MLCSGGATICRKKARGPCGGAGSPLFLLTARDDELVAPAQLLAAARLLGTPHDAIETVTAPGPHLSLFLGHQTVVRTWPRIAHWLQ